MYQKILAEQNSPWHEFSYLEYLPKNYESRNDWPLLVFLHGSGERGNDRTLDSIATYCYFQNIAAGQEYPFVIAAPQCPEEQFWGCYTESLNHFLDELLQRYRVDASRIWLCGLSMGGTGCWMWGMANPERFAAMVPMCGTGIVWNAGKLIHIPIWAFHGDCDEGVLPEESLRMVSAVNRLGGNAKLTLYPHVGHDCWNLATGDPALTEWLLKQKKNG